MRAIIAGLESAGVKQQDIVAYDRYRDQFINHRRVNRVVDYAYENFAEPVDLDSLADVARGITESPDTRDR